MIQRKINSNTLPTKTMTITAVLLINCFYWIYLIQRKDTLSYTKQQQQQQQQQTSTTKVIRYVFRINYCLIVLQNLILKSRFKHRFCVYSQFNWQLTFSTMIYLSTCKYFALNYHFFHLFRFFFPGVNAA